MKAVRRQMRCGYRGLLFCIAATNLVFASDWTRFRGPAGAGIGDESPVPVQWSESRNLKWKTALPGAGSSSPIVVGDKVLVTCYSGEDIALKRHLVCVQRLDGKIIWSKTVVAQQPEDAYNGYLTEHGYASNTPVTDGQRAYVFFGKSGVLAYDLDGNELWHVNVGKESSNRRWGSGASLVLYEDTVIVNAAEESQSIRALRKETGQEVWKAEAAALELAYGTPTLVKLKNGHSELVISVPGEVWGLDPGTGKLQWYAETNLTGNVCPSVVVGDDGVVYVFGGFRSSGSHAIRTGGKGDVTDSHMLWSKRNSSYVATPLFHGGHLYWVDDRGQAFCVEARTGDVVYRQRLRASRGRPFYASPVLAGGKLYVVSRWNGTYVFAAKPEFEQLAQNEFTSDGSDFNATPAISSGALFFRSNQFLYCVANE